MRKPFFLDKPNGKLMGVCAGLARMTGWDATLIRIAAVVGCIAFPWAIIGYVAAALIAKPAPRGRYGEEDSPLIKARMSIHELKRTMGDFDRRLAEIDSCMASVDSPLAREIETLR